MYIFVCAGPVSIVSFIFVFAGPVSIVRSAYIRVRWSRFSQFTWDVCMKANLIPIWTIYLIKRDVMSTITGMYLNIRITTYICFRGCDVCSKSWH